MAGMMKKKGYRMGGMMKKKGMKNGGKVNNLKKVKAKKKPAKKMTMAQELIYCFITLELTGFPD